MKTSVRNLSLAALATLAGSHLACTTVVENTTTGTPSSVPDDIADALAALPEAKVIAFHDDGVPMFIVGELAQVGGLPADPVAAEVALRPALDPVLAPFRLEPTDLVFTKAHTDELGGRHFRYQQVHNGLPVIGGDMIVHIDEKGAISGINGTARGDLFDGLGASPIAMTAASGRISGDARWTGMTQSAMRTVYLQTEDGARHEAYESVVAGMRGQDPVRDKVYVDVTSGAIVAVYPQIHFAENRKVYSANNGTSLPGTLRRSEGQAATNDVDVNAAYDNTGASYEAYKLWFNRDSYNNAGGGLNSSVHYSSNYCNAYWDGSQMVYGDGSSGCNPLARSVDVTAHELTHGVTEYESGLVYSGESGGMNEAMSDIFAAWVEAWVDGGKNGTNLTISTSTWLVGEDVVAPALRYMCDPAADGASKDIWTSSVGSVDVHYSSGVGNLAFCLLSKGGTHPRGKTTVNVPGIGLDKAIRIMYKAQTDYITSTAKYANVRTAMEQAATALGYDQATKDAVGCAWAAVAVGTAPSTCNGGTPPPPPPPGNDGVLVSGTPQTNISDVSGGQKFWKIDVPANQQTLTITINGGTGDADLYVQFGNKPTTSSYACRPYLNGNTETCTFSPPQAGTYWVMLHAYAAYSGLTITGTYSASGGGGGGDPYLSNGVSVTNITGASGSAQYWRVNVPAGRSVTVRIAGSTGDADLYTRFGSRPTTSTYSCRPYLNTSNETCTVSSTTAGDHYVMVRGYTAYSGLSLVASY